MDGTLITYLIVAALLVASPGPDSILILKNTLTSGRVAGTMTVIGVQIGIVLHALLSVAGLSALLYYSPAAFRALAFAGSLYLAYLGYLTLTSGIVPPAAQGARVSTRHGFMQGMLCNLLNPKVIILFIALMPTFVVPAAGNEKWQLLVLALLLLAINVPFQLMLVLIAGYISRLLANKSTAQWIQRGFGAALFFFACTLFVEHVLATTQAGGG